MIMKVIIIVMIVVMMIVVGVMFFIDNGDNVGSDLNMMIIIIHSHIITSCSIGSCW